jgi:hypothetical protein
MNRRFFLRFEIKFVIFFNMYIFTTTVMNNIIVLPRLPVMKLFFGVVVPDRLAIPALASPTQIAAAKIAKRIMAALRRMAVSPTTRLCISYLRINIDNQYDSY